MANNTKLLQLAIMASVASVLAAPTSTASTTGAAASPVQFFSANVHGPNTSALPHVPSNLPAQEKAFLDKYQPASDAASKFIGQKSRDRFASAGYCFSEYPCFSVENAAAVSIDNVPFITQTQASQMMDHILAQPRIHFEGPTANHSFTGLKLTVGNVVLDVISPPGIVPSKVMAGFVFDMYKMQSGDPSTNSIRALQAASDTAPYANVAFCLYPAGINETAALNFCVGKELDGTLKKAAQNAKRFSLDGLFNDFCNFLDIPVLCP
jgi:hypothetical protein